MAAADDRDGATINFLMAIGTLTRSWAILEVMVNLLIALIFKFMDGRKIEPVAPYSLRRKIEFLKRAFRNLAPLTAQQHNALPLLNEIRVASNFRHAIIHGIAIDDLSEKDVHMKRLLRGTDRLLDHKEITVSTKDILFNASEVSNLAARVHNLLLQTVRDYQ